MTIRGSSTIWVAKNKICPAQASSCLLALLGLSGGLHYAIGGFVFGVVLLGGIKKCGGRSPRAFLFLRWFYYKSPEQGLNLSES